VSELSGVLRSPWAAIRQCCGDTGDRTCRDRVIPADDQRHVAPGHDVAGAVGECAADQRDRVEVVESAGCVDRLTSRDCNVAGVLDHVPERFQSRFEPSVTHGRGTHLDSASRLSQVHLDTEHLDRGHMVTATPGVSSSTRSRYSGVRAARNASRVPVSSGKVL
jgi:hypothetical protein